MKLFLSMKLYISNTILEDIISLNILKNKYFKFVAIIKVFSQLLSKIPYQIKPYSHFPKWRPWK